MKDCFSHLSRNRPSSIFEPSDRPATMSSRFSTTREYRGKAIGFSLIEVVLAIGIIAVALVPLMALMPTAMQVHRDAVESTLIAQMLQRVTFDAQQTEFENLIDGSSSIGPYFFDDQGTSVDENDPSRLFDVQVTLVSPAIVPSDEPDGSSSSNLAQLRIELARNPGGNLQTPFDDSREVTRRFAYVAKNDQF